MLRLVVDCEDQVHYFPIAGSADLTLGSTSENDICLPFEGVSRHHAQLRLVGGGVIVRDAGSKNGIVDPEGARHDELLLMPGGTVRVGRAVIALEEVSTSDVELAFAVDTTPRSGRRRRTASGTGDDASDHELGSPRDALRLVRELDRLGPEVVARRSARLLEKARNILAARSLLVVGSGPSGLTVAAHSGRALDDEQLDLLEGRLERDMAPSGRSTIPEGGGVTCLTWHRSGATTLVAAFAGASPAPWREDFLEYLAGRLFGPSAPYPETAAEGAGESGQEDPVLTIPEGMVLGSSEAMMGLLKHLRIAVKTDLDVLLVGETGTGKELFARMIHQSGPTASGPFVAVNCAAIPNELLEAELFGVLAGAATGVDARPGLFLKANGGAIFLDEITEMADHLHAKLLRVVQEREVLPVGGSTAKKIKVRVISACNRDLVALVREGRFRADLFYRLRGLQFHIPPLRERGEDLPDLVLAFVARAAKKYRKRVAGLSRKALRILREHDWPGNVRELETEVERAVLLCPDGASLESEHFASVRWELAHRKAQTLLSEHAISPVAWSESESMAPPKGGDLQGKLDAVEREAIAAALGKAGGNKTKAAALLGVTRNGLRLKMIRLSIQGP